MKKTKVTVFALFISAFYYSQVGINKVTPTSTLDINGSLGVSIKTAYITANYTVTEADHTLNVNAASEITLTLPDPTTCKGRIYTITNASSANQIKYSVVLLDAMTGGGRNFTPVNGWDQIQSNGTNWVVISKNTVVASSDWALTGNSGTIAGTNFLGTTDNQDLVFKRNSLQGGIIADGPTALGVGALSSYVQSLPKVGITAIGYNSLKNATSAVIANTSVGGYSMASSSTGDFNTAIGNASLNSLTTGSTNVALGMGAGENITTGSNNIIIGGNVALAPIATGSNQMNIGNAIFGTEMTSSDFNAPAGNIGIGTSAPTSKLEINGSLGVPIKTAYITANYTVTEADHTLNVNAASQITLTLPDPTTCKGRMYTITNASSANQVAYNVLLQDGMTGGGRNITPVNGWDQIQSNGTNWVVISKNTVLGSYWGLTGNSGTTAGTNFLGTTDNQDLVFKRNGLQSGWLNDGATQHTSFGARSLPTTTTGFQNTAIGNLSLAVNTTGSYNTAIGFGTLRSNTSGYLNTAIGFGALNSNTTGYGNTALGYQAAYNITSALSNTAVGREALYSNVSSFSNSAFGYRTLNKATSGYNSAFGTASFTELTTGGNNTGFGFATGQLTTTGSDNTFVGHNAGVNVTTGSNNIMIGINAIPTSATANNQLNIGNAIFGTGMTGSAALPAGNIGIGTTAPTSRLEVNGSATNTTAFNAGTTTAINFANSNLAYTTASAGAFTLTNIKDGGTYTLNVRGTTSGTASFSATGFTFKYVNNVATMAGKESIYTLMVFGTVVYVYTASGF